MSFLFLAVFRFCMAGFFGEACAQVVERKGQDWSWVSLPHLALLVVIAIVLCVAALPPTPTLSSEGQKDRRKRPGETAADARNRIAREQQEFEAAKQQQAERLLLLYISVFLIGFLASLLSQFR